MRQSRTSSPPYAVAVCLRSQRTPVSRTAKKFHRISASGLNQTAQYRCRLRDVPRGAVHPATSELRPHHLSYCFFFFCIYFKSLHRFTCHSVPQEEALRSFPLPLRLLSVLLFSKSSGLSESRMTDRFQHWFSFTKEARS